MNPLKKGPEIKFKLPKKLPRPKLNLSRPKLKMPNPGVKAPRPKMKVPGAEKLPNVKVPAFAADTYRDLRDRHLLPLVALLIIGIVAVPILLSESSASPDKSSVPNPGGGQGGSPAPASVRSVVVSRSAPELRNYHRRLSHRSSADPFKQKYTDTPAEEDSSASSSGEEGEATITSEEQTITTHHELKYFTYTIDVRITPLNSEGNSNGKKPTVRRNLPELTPLPARQIPALTFMEPAADAKRAVMLVSDKVEGVFGDNQCASGGETCQLLVLEPGVPETVVYGGAEHTYRIELIQVNFEETDKLTKAPLHKKKSQNGSGGSKSGKGKSFPPAQRKTGAAPAVQSATEAR
jgi:hypothetical protein